MLRLKTTPRPSVDDLLDLATAAGLLATDPTNLTRARREHKLPSYQVPSKTLYRRGDLKLYASILRQPPAAKPTPRVAPTDPIEVLGLSTRTKNALRAEGVDLVEQLAAKSFADLTRISGIGPSSLFETIEALAEAGYALSDHDRRLEGRR
ncbi:MAG: hypothetical protein EOM21_13015 [Gammaproteobacteria bacterium]|nr:hypothetical protein [Gammaproteobacteria bacterium]